MDYIVLIVENMYLNNLVKIVTLLSILIQVRYTPTNIRKRSQISLLSIVERERSINSTVYLFFLSILHKELSYY